MSAGPPADRVVVRLAIRHPVGGAGLVALEDYARELTRARAAEALVAEGEPDRLVGVALDGPAIAPQGRVLEDIEAFARDLAERSSPGLGWS